MFFEVKEFYFVLDYHSWNFIIAFFNTMNSTLLGPGSTYE